MERVFFFKNRNTKGSTLAHLLLLLDRNLRHHLLMMLLRLLGRQSGRSWRRQNGGLLRLCRVERREHVVVGGAGNILMSWLQGWSQVVVCGRRQHHSGGGGGLNVARERCFENYCHKPVVIPIFGPILQINRCTTTLATFGQMWTRNCGPTQCLVYDPREGVPIGWTTYMQNTLWSLLFLFFEIW